MAQEPKVNILSPRSTRKQPSQKRALPPRHSFLTEAVEVALQKQQRTDLVYGSTLSFVMGMLKMILSIV